MLSTLHGSYVYKDMWSLCQQLTVLVGWLWEGFEVFLRSCLQATRSGGVVVLVGLGAPEIKMPIVDASVREVDIRGIFRYTNW